MTGKLGGQEASRVTGSSVSAADENGVLLYAEPEGRNVTASASAWREMSTALGLTSPRVLAERMSVRIGDAAKPEHETGIALHRVTGPSGRRLFPDTPVVPPQTWALRQIAPIPPIPAR